MSKQIKNVKIAKKKLKLGDFRFSDLNLNNFDSGISWSKHPAYIKRDRDERSESSKGYILSGRQHTHRFGQGVNDIYQRTVHVNIY